MSTWPSLQVLLLLDSIILVPIGDNQKAEPYQSKWSAVIKNSILAPLHLPLKPIHRPVLVRTCMHLAWSGTVHVPRQNVSINSRSIETARATERSRESPVQGTGAANSGAQHLKAEPWQKTRPPELTSGQFGGSPQPLAAIYYGKCPMSPEAICNVTLKVFQEVLRVLCHRVRPIFIFGAVCRDEEGKTIMHVTLCASQY